MDLSKYDNQSFDRGASRAKEAAWLLVRCLFFLNPLPFPSSFKVTLLRAFGAKVGTGVVIRPRVSVTFPWRVTIGNHVWIGEEVTILSLASITIGSNVCLSQKVFLCSGSHDHRRPSFDLITESITIESESWIAAQAFIGAGVTVGARSIVSAATVLLDDLPSDYFARGNPASIRARSQGEMGATGTGS